MGKWVPPTLQCYILNGFTMNVLNCHYNYYSVGSIHTVIFLVEIVYQLKLNTFHDIFFDIAIKVI